MTTYSRSVFSALLILAVFAAGSASVSAASSPKACSADNMCAKGEICSDEKIGYGNTKRICIPGCRKSGDCPASNPVCFKNQCGTKICEPGDSRACYDGSPETRNVGLCKAGAQYCELGGRKWSACMEQTLPQPETCDQEDNNCNGRVDEGITCECKKPGTSRDCYRFAPATKNVGECRSGKQWCQHDHTWSECAGDQGPSQDFCGDEKDNNCNGIVDDGCPRKFAPATQKPTLVPKPGTGDCNGSSGEECIKRRDEPIVDTPTVIEPLIPRRP